jgi:hypothetical protein
LDELGRLGGRDAVGILAEVDLGKGHSLAGADLLRAGWAVRRGHAGHVPQVRHLAQHGLDLGLNRRVVHRSGLGLEHDLFGITGLAWDRLLQQVGGGGTWRTGQCGAGGVMSAGGRLAEEGAGQHQQPYSDYHQAMSDTPASDRTHRNLLC